MFRVTGTKIEVIRGDTGILNFSVVEETLQEGDTVYLTVKRRTIDETAAIQKRVTSFTEGIATFVFTADDTTLAVGTYVYDIQCNFADGRVDTVIGPAEFIVLPEVTTE